MYFELQQPADAPFSVNLDKIIEKEPRTRFADLSPMAAQYIVDYASHNDIDHSLFSWVTGTYETPIEDLHGNRLDNALYPQKTLDERDVKQLHTFVDKVIDTIDNKYDDQALAERKHSLDDEEYRKQFDREYDELSADVDNWRQNPSEPQYEEVNRRISDAFEQLFNQLTGNLAVRQGSKLRYNLSRSKRPFVYADIGEQVDDDQVKLDPQEFRRSTLRAVLRYGVESAHGDASERGILKDHGTQLTALADRWQAQIQREFVNHEDLLYDKRKSEFEFDDFLVAGYALCVLLDNPWRELSAETLQSCFQSTADLTLDTTLATGLQDGYVSDDQIEVFRTLVGLSPWFEDLLEARVSFSGNRLDLVDVRKRMTEHAPYAVLDAVVQSGIERISQRVRFNSDTNLRDLATAARKSNQHLSELESNTSKRDLPARVSKSLSDVQMTEIESLVTDLRRSYQNLMQAEFAEQLTELTEFEQEDIDTVLTGAAIANRDEYSKMARIHSTLASTKLEAHPLVAIISNLEELQTIDSDTFAPVFSEVSEYYVN